MAPRLSNLCRALGISILRVGGSSQDQVTYDFSPSPVKGGLDGPELPKVLKEGMYPKSCLESLYDLGHVF